MFKLNLNSFAIKESQTQFSWGLFFNKVLRKMASRTFLLNDGEEIHLHIHRYRHLQLP